MRSFYDRQSNSNTSSVRKNSFNYYDGNHIDNEAYKIKNDFDSILCDDSKKKPQNNKVNYDSGFFISNDDEFNNKAFIDRGTRPLSPQEFFSRRNTNDFAVNEQRQNYLVNDFDYGFADNENRPMTPQEFIKTKNYRLESQNKDIEYKQEYIKKNSIAKPKKRKLMAYISLIVISILIISGYFVCNDLIFVAKNINIDGISKYSYKDILNVAGIKEGQSLSRINSKAVEKRINDRNDLELIKFNFIYPNGIYISVLEKQPIALVSSNGYYYVLDKDADVINRLDKLEDNGLIKITNCNMMQNLSKNRSEIRLDWQKKAYTDVLNAISDLKMNDIISTFSLSKPDSLYLYTKNGFVIRIGSSDRAVDKIAVASSVLSYLETQGKKEGRIDVSIPEKPVFASEENRVLYDPKYHLEMSPSEFEKNQSETQQNENIQDENMQGEIPQIEDSQDDLVFVP